MSRFRVCTIRGDPLSASIAPVHPRMEGDVPLPANEGLPVASCRSEAPICTANAGTHQPPPFECSVSRWTRIGEAQGEEDLTYKRLTRLCPFGANVLAPRLLSPLRATVRQNNRSAGCRAFARPCRPFSDGQPQWSLAGKIGSSRGRKERSRTRTACMRIREGGGGKGQLERGEVEVHPSRGSAVALTLGAWKGGPEAVTAV